MKKIVDGIKKDGGVNSNTFWKMRKELTKKQENAHAITYQNGRLQVEPEEIKKGLPNLVQETANDKTS